MLYGLDPYTSFIPASDEETLKRLRSGQYGGIGSIITLVDGKPYLSEPYFGMPAQVNGCVLVMRLSKLMVKDVKVNQFQK
jgi:carboxyl-terminal processing protease